MSSGGRALVFCTLLLTSTLTASWTGTAAALPSSEFRYLRDEGAAQCPNENELRAAVSARLGYDPFRRGASLTIRASIETMPDGFRARVELEGGHDGAAKREIVTKGNCAELVSAIALSISLAIDAEGATASSAQPGQASFEAPPSAPAAAPPPPAAAPTPTPATQPEPKSEPKLKPKSVERASPEEIEAWRDEPARAQRRDPHISLPFNFAVGSYLQLLSGSAPSTALGGSIFVQARRNWLSLQLELRVDAPSAGISVDSGARISTGVAAFQFVPCAHFEWAKVCGVGLIGEIWASAQGLPTNRTDLTVYSAAGMRLGFEWPEKAIWALSLHGDVMALITGVQVLVDSSPQWEAPGTYFSLGAGALVRF